MAFELQSDKSVLVADPLETFYCKWKQLIILLGIYNGTSSSVHEYVCQ